MRVAVTIWQGRISPVFDVSRQLVLLTVEKGHLVERSLENTESLSAIHKAARLLELGVNLLICGAVSKPIHSELLESGIEVIGFTSGDLEEVMQAFLGGTLPSPAFSMPGCCGKPRRFRHFPGQSGRCGKRIRNT
jgi:predicted Fe-Mo cluster-binding NifX family protein